jgi:DHA2 family multidrug resistance protein-like MFS transporter
MAATVAAPSRGTDNSLIVGIVLAVVTFWLFAQTMLNVAPAIRADLQISESLSNIAVNITALFSGIFIVVAGGLADRFGRVKLTYVGLASSALGSLLIALSPAGTAFFLMTGRIIQGLSAACIVVGFTLFGVGLGFYATPSTDAALSNVPGDKAGAASGIYKMASSLGAALGVAISAALFTALSGLERQSGPLSDLFLGRTDNIDIRFAAAIALLFNVLMVVVAIIAIALTVPRDDPGVGR